MYARAKANLPHAQRMENITWRMMALALKKKKEHEDAPAACQGSVRVKFENTDPSPSITQLDLPSSEPVEERGRPVAKGKAKVQVVGFDGTNQDGTEDDEYVITSTPCLGFRDANLLQRRANGLAGHEQVTISNFYGLATSKSFSLPAPTVSDTV